MNQQNQAILNLKFKIKKIIYPQEKPDMFNSVLDFKNLEIKNAIYLAQKHESIKNNESQQREFFVTVSMRNQRIDFNMENPEADYKKGIPSNCGTFLQNSNTVHITVQEKHYRLERDEEAFIQSLRDNMANHQQMTQFLNNKTGGNSRSEENQKGLSDIIKKKKIQTNHMNPKCLYDGDIQL